jgi:hypothetical protein
VIRLRAIWYALWFGLLPWWCYERTPHYAFGYREHLRRNLRLAWLWATWHETQGDYEFELTVNRK